MRTWNDQLSQRTSPPPTVTFEPCGVTMSTGFGTDRYLPESSYASLGTSVGVGSAPRSVTESTVPAAMSTVASRPSIGLPQRLLVAPVVSTQGTFSKRRPAIAGSLTGPAASGKQSTLSYDVMPRFAIAACHRGSFFGRSLACIISSTVAPDDSQSPANLSAS